MKSTLLEYIDQVIESMIMESLHLSEDQTVPQQGQDKIAQMKAGLQQNSDQVLQANKDKLQKKGINVDNLKKLGTGTEGVAYDIGNGQVLKVTKDKKEAKASGIVVGKDIPNVVKIYDLWQFPNSDWYGIVLERLTPLTPKEEDELTNKIKQLGPLTKDEAAYVGADPGVVGVGFPGLLYVAKDSFTQAQKLLAKMLVKRFYGQPDAQQKTAAAIQDFNALMNQYKMVDLFRSLKSLGVKYYDFHGGNFGTRPDGTIVLFDLGRSISQGNMPAELQEKYNLFEAVILS